MDFFLKGFNVYCEVEGVVLICCVELLFVFPSCVLKVYLEEYFLVFVVEEVKRSGRDGQGSMDGTLRKGVVKQGSAVIILLGHCDLEVRKYLIMLGEGVPVEFWNRGRVTHLSFSSSSTGN